jgi:thiamine biosynthesis lipoprotein
MQSPRETSRRDFLQGKSATEQLLDLTQGSDPLPNPIGSGKTASSDAANGSLDSTAKGPYLSHLGRAAMACQFELYFNGGQFANSTLAGLEAFDRIEQLEEQLSVYREQSEISHVNRVAAFAPVVVEAGLFGLLEQALRIHEESRGAFDITASPLSRAWGFFRRAGKLPSNEELDKARALVGSQFVVLDQECRSVRFEKPGIELSLNSIGKGYALDRAADLLFCHGVSDFMFHGGQSSVLAAGAHAATPERGWTIGLQHPLRPELRLAEFFLRDEALATSGTGRQHFHFQGRRYGHILDPRTGMPADGVYSSTVIARTAAEADALATAFYVLGPDLAREYCQSHTGVGMLIVTPGEKQGSIAVHTSGLREDSWRMCEDI